MEYATIASISLLLILLRILYRYLKEPFSYWEKLGIPSVPGIPLVGSMLDVITKNFHDVDLSRCKKYGRIYGHYENTRPVLNVTEPELLRDILVKDFQSFSNRRDFGGWDPMTRDMVSNMKGEAWKRVRTIITPAFSTGKIKKMFSTIVDSAETLCKNLKPEAKGRKKINAKRIFGTFSMDVIASCAFATKLDSHSDPDNPFVTTASRAFNAKFPWRFMGIFLLPSIMKLFRVSVFDPEATSFFKTAVLSIIEQRKKFGKKGNDLLQLMMEASNEANKGNLVQDKQDLEEEDESLKDIGHEEGSENIFKLSSTRGLSDNETVANSVIFFFAGYDTTASTLSFASYFLAINPSCQETLIAEIDENIRQHQNQITYEAVQNMKYLDMVISETLRFYPPAVRTERVADEDYKLGSTGIVVKKGMIVGIPIYAIHHDDENYPVPEKFDPLRFSPGEKAKRDAYTYLPFGAGPRNCLGMRFALIEIKICLAYFFSQFRAKRCPQTKVPLEFRRGQGLLQPTEVIFEIEERHDKILGR